MGDRTLVAVLKIDIDYKMDKQLLREFIDTRKTILYSLGYEVKRVKYIETEKGYHFWFTIFQGIGKKLTDKRKAELQFLLGDDIIRARYNFMREELGAFDTFNALFSEKIKEKVNFSKLLVKWLKNKLKVFLL